MSFSAYAAREAAPRRRASRFGVDHHAVVGEPHPFAKKAQAFGGGSEPAGDDHQVAHLNTLAEDGAIAHPENGDRDGDGAVGGRKIPAHDSHPHLGGPFDEPDLHELTLPTPIPAAWWPTPTIPTSPALSPMLTSPLPV